MSDTSDIPPDIAAHASVWFRFCNPHYARHNQRRQEHLASLGLPLEGRSVLEVGAGIGDHTTFFIDRSCQVTITEGRPENLEVIRLRYPVYDVRHLDLDAPPPDFAGRFEVIYCYGLLYHLANPAEALAWLAERCSGLLLLETCVAPTDEETIFFHDEPMNTAENSVSGRGCRPSRRWVMARLGEHFEHVYATTTQPWHPEFPLDWTTPPPDPWLARTVFVAAREPLASPSLTRQLLPLQERH